MRVSFLQTFQMEFTLQEEYRILIFSKAVVLAPCWAGLPLVVLSHNSRGI